MKDRLTSAAFYSQSNNGQKTNEPGVTKSKKLCCGFNKGKCTYGSKCKFDHRCGMCNRYEHGAHNCKKAGGVPFSNKDA